MTRCMLIYNMDVISREASLLDVQIVISLKRTTKAHYKTNIIIPREEYYNQSMPTIENPNIGIARLDLFGEYPFTGVDDATGDLKKYGSN